MELIQTKQKKKDGTIQVQKGQYKTLPKVAIQVSVQKVNLRITKELPTKELQPDSTSPDLNCDNQPQKKQAIDMTETQKTKTSIDSDNSTLNPELTELKR